MFGDAPSLDSEAVLELMFVHQFAYCRKELCHTPKFFVPKAMVHRTVSSVLAGDCVNREIMAS